MSEEKYKYKVWVHVEEIGEEGDHYEDVREPMDVGTFDNVDDADKMQNIVTDACESVQTFLKTCVAHDDSRSGSTLLALAIQKRLFEKE